MLLSFGWPFFQMERYDDFIVLFSGVLRNNAFSAILKSKALPQAMK